MTTFSVKYSWNAVVSVLTLFSLLQKIVAVKGHLHFLMSTTVWHHREQATATGDRRE